jgi:CheY-like chemotaxis protein
MGYTTRPGSGSEFWVSLPAIDSAAVATAARTVPAPAPTGAKVLVIDDDNMVRTVLARMLETQYDVSATASASDALMTIRDGARFDVIFCDLMMPKLNGMQFFRHLSDTHPELAERVVFLSGGAHTEEGRAFLDEPLRKVINKPFTADELFRTIEGCLS